MTTEIFPIIDVSENLGDFSSKSSDIVKACTNWGFFVLVGYGIPHEVVDRMHELNQEFHESSAQEKSTCPIDERQVGYDLKHSVTGAHESMVFGGVRGEVIRGINLHPYWNVAKRKEIEDFKSRCNDLAHKLLRIFAINFGLPVEYFTSAHDDAKNPPDVLRMLHYPAMKEKPSDEIPRLYSHTDWGSLTFVWPRSEGLEVETPKGNWLPVPLIPGGVVVNIGDALSLWSGMALKSTLHKISFDNLPINQSRLSMAYFVNANQDARLEVLSRQDDGKMAPQPGGIVLTAGEYYDARMYGSRRHDAERNWVSKAKAEDLIHYEGVLEKLVQVGVANRSLSSAGPIKV